MHSLFFFPFYEVANCIRLSPGSNQSLIRQPKWEQLRRMKAPRHRGLEDLLQTNRRCHAWGAPGCSPAAQANRRTLTLRAQAVWKVKSSAKDICKLTEHIWMGEAQSMNWSIWSISSPKAQTIILDQIFSQLAVQVVWVLFMEVFRYLLSNNPDFIFKYITVFVICKPLNSQPMLLLSWCWQSQDGGIVERMSEVFCHLCLVWRRPFIIP